jgi:hypothetical protein
MKMKMFATAVLAVVLSVFASQDAEAQRGRGGNYNRGNRCAPGYVKPVRYYNNNCGPNYRRPNYYRSYAPVRAYGYRPNCGPRYRAGGFYNAPGFSATVTYNNGYGGVYYNNRNCGTGYGNGRDYYRRW